eukprot:SAG31_NODE_212_length_20157_cov_9.648868_13_plen_535_part_00
MAAAPQQVHGAIKSLLVRVLLDRFVARLTIQMRVSAPPNALERPGDGRPGPQWQLLVVLGSIGIAIAYSDRSNISTAIVAMRDEFAWSAETEGWVLSAFFAGYTCTQAIGGHLSDRHGGKLVLLLGVVLWSVMTALTPPAAFLGGHSIGPLLIARCFLGLGEGIAFPAMMSLIRREVRRCTLPPCSALLLLAGLLFLTDIAARAQTMQTMLRLSCTQVPVYHRTVASAVVVSASYVGVLAAFELSPWIIAHRGWPSAFYFFAALSIPWLPFWLLWKPAPQQGRIIGPGANKPVFRKELQLQDDDDVQLSDEDAEMLPSAIRNDTTRIRSHAGNTGRPGDWRIIVTSLLRERSVWAICGGQFGQSVGMFGLLSWLPTYFVETYGIDLSSTGSLTALPYMGQIVVGVGVGIAADRTIQKAVNPGVRLYVRQVVHVVGTLGPAGCMLLLGAAGSWCAKQHTLVHKDSCYVVCIRSIPTQIDVLCCAVQAWPTTSVLHTDTRNVSLIGDCRIAVCLPQRHLRKPCRLNLCPWCVWSRV